MADCCAVEECGRPAKRQGLCWGHYRRKRLGKPVDRPLAVRSESLYARAVRTALRYADAESDEEFRAASRALRRVAHRETTQRAPKE